ncbi:MAG TPA: hypothetical protein VL588_12195, partial [Bdellovibrionota bacterium]|nr:hypothetical protein [Bdellovibrionota bacterium]
IFVWGMPMALLFPVIAAVAITGGPARYAFNSVLDQWVVPLLYALGAAACAQQALYLSKGRKFGMWVPVRVRRLTLFTTGLMAISVLYLLQSHGLLPFQVKVLVSRFAHFGLVLFLGGIALAEWREQKRLAEHIPVSPYHRRPVLPDRVSGAVLVADLKSSETLFRVSALRGDAGALVESCLSHMWSSVASMGGVVLQTEGDQIRVFFDRAICRDPAATALAAVDLMASNLAELEHRFHDQGVLPDDGYKLEFRAGVALGDIKPVWHEMEGLRLAAWAEAGSTNAFVESARMLELGRSVPGAENGSVAVFVSTEAPTSRFPGEWLCKEHLIQGKHGREYRVSAYVPPRETGTRSVAA